MNTATRVNIVSKKLVTLQHLRAGPISFLIDADELPDIIQALTEAAGLFVHLADGCEDDSCPCYARGAGR
jgi:hypothetical protein